MRSRSDPAAKTDGGFDFSVRRVISGRRARLSLPDVPRHGTGAPIKMIYACFKTAAVLINIWWDVQGAFAWLGSVLVLAFRSRGCFRNNVFLLSIMTFVFEQTQTVPIMKVAWGHLIFCRFFSRIA